MILCHGLWANRFNLDFGPGLSLARHLAERGFDVFVLELRGSGFSADPGPEGPRGKAARAYGFDAHVTLDAPAALAEVRRVTGAAQVFWVGHSMGGMLGYVLAGGPERRGARGGGGGGQPGALRRAAQRWSGASAGSSPPWRGCAPGRCRR